jgi:hypothetical protein
MASVPQARRFASGGEPSSSSVLRHVYFVDHLHLAAAVALDAQEPRGERSENALSLGRTAPTQIGAEF